MSPHPWQFIEVLEASSTNDLAKEYPLWTSIRAVVQTRGRGQRGRTWHSQEGGLWASYVIESIEHPAPSLIVGAALVAELRVKWDLPALRLKYPNDLYLGSEKLGGILIEKPNSQSMIVGIGLNVSNRLPPVSELRNPATSLANVMNQPPSLSELQLTIAQILQKTVSSPTIDLHQAWSPDPIKVLIKTHTVNHSGTFLGVTPSGSPIIKLTSNQLLEIQAHEVLSFEEIDQSYEFG